MSDTVNAILDAAEGRIRDGGYNGFSFRDIAADVGIKSSSVHHHFPAKATLAAAVAIRYTERFYGGLDGSHAEPLASRMRGAFRDAINRDGKMCLCGVLGSEAGSLPQEVAMAARNFFSRGLDLLTTDFEHRGDSSQTARRHAFHVMAALEGGMLLARAFGSVDAFEQATFDLPR